MRSIIGVTGGIASGKSTFLSILGEQGFVTISSDDIVKKLYEKDAAGYRELLKLDIKDLLDNKGNINKHALRDLLFSDTKMRAKVEKAVHPLVIKEIKDQIKSHASKDIAVEIPLLFEAGLEKICTHVVTIYATEEMMTNNLVSRYGVRKDKALEMISAQMDIQTKMQKSDFVIKNTGTLDELKEKTLELIKAIRKKGE